MRTLRSLHLIDLENLCGSGLPPTEVIEHVWRTYRFGVATSAGDHFVVGSSHSFAARAWWVLPAQGIQRCVRSGEDGGELSILTGLDLDHAVKRFERLIIASGDGMFTETARIARQRGLHVHQVVGLGRPSQQLAATAHTHARLRLDALELMSARTVVTRGHALAA